MPIRIFWVLNAEIERVRSEEDLRAFQVANRASAGEQAQEYVEGLRKNLKNVFVVEGEGSDERDEAGILQLKLLAQAM
jgi:hypothetical protein